MLVVLSFLIFGLVLLSFWFNHGNTVYIASNAKTNRERIDKMTKEIKQSVDFVVENQTSLDKRIDEITRYTHLYNKSMDTHLDKLTALVNSDMMAARRDELIRTKELKVALERIVTLTTLSRQQPDSMYIMAIETTTSRIEELETILGIRTYD